MNKAILVVAFLFSAPPAAVDACDGAAVFQCQQQLIQSQPVIQSYVQPVQQFVHPIQYQQVQAIQSYFQPIQQIQYQVAPVVRQVVVQRQVIRQRVVRQRVIRSRMRIRRNVMVQRIVTY